MNDAGSVVVEDVAKRQVDNAVHSKRERKGNYDECSKFIIVLERYIET